MLRRWVPEYYWEVPASIILQRTLPTVVRSIFSDGHNSYLEMVRAAATNFPASVYEPPPESVSNMPSLNLQLGGVNVSLGGPSGTGVYRTSGDGVGVQTDGIRDGMRNLMGKVKQGVDRIGIS
jgi:vacuolar protein sorting-associated protein 45